MGGMEAMANLACEKGYHHWPADIQVKEGGPNKVRKGGATLQLSWTANPKLWALTLFFKLHAPYFRVLGYIWICMRQISQKVPLSTCFLQKGLESTDLGASQQCIIF